MKRLTSAVTVGLLAACSGGGSGASSSHQTLDTLKCPAGQVPYDFGRFHSELTSEALAQAGASFDAGRRVNQIAIVDVTCRDEFHPDGGSAVQAVNYFSKRCDLLTDCAVGADDFKQKRELISQTGCGLEGMSVKYTCSDDDSVVGIRTTDALHVSCPLPKPSPRFACVPENCYGHTRRDTLLQCAPDLLKPVEALPVLSLTSVQPQLIQVHPREYPDNPKLTQAFADIARWKPMWDATDAGQPRLNLAHEQVYEFEGTVRSSGTSAPRQTVTLWMQSTITTPGSLIATTDVLRCVVGKFDLAKYQPADGGTEVAFKERFRLPTHCSDGEPFKAAVKASLLGDGVDLTTVKDADLPTTALTTELKASYDLDDRALVVAPKSTEAVSCSVKPLDFFYNYRARAFDSRSYYSQNAMQLSAEPAKGRPFTMSFRDGQTLIAATEAHVRRLEYKVNMAGRARGQIAADVSIVIQGIEAQKASNLLGMDEAVMKFEGEAPQALKGEFFVDLNRYAAGSDTALVLVPDPTVKNQFGRYVTGMEIGVPFLNARLFTKAPVGESGTSIPLFIGIDRTVRAMLAQAGVAPGVAKTFYLRVCPSGISTKWTTGPKDLLDWQKVPGGWYKWSVTDTAWNNCVDSNLFSIRGENVVTPLEEPEVSDGDVTDAAPTTSGESRLSGTFDGDEERTCTGSTCETHSSQAMGGSAEPIAAPIFTTDSEDDEDDMTGKFATEFKLFGFDVLNESFDSPPKSAKTTITISPNWEPILEKLGKKTPGFRVKGKRIAAGINGISMGVEYKVPVRYGPAQGFLIFGVGTGVGIGLVLEHEANLSVEASCAASNADGSPQTNCPTKEIALPAMPFKDARDRCNFLGGELAEPRSTAMVGKMRAALAAGTEQWVGAQVGNEYRSDQDCAQVWNASVCKTGHTMLMRWLSDAENLMSSNSFSPFAVATPRELADGSFTGETPDSNAPVDARAVTLKDSFFATRKLTDSYPSVCTREAVAKGQSHKASITLEAGFSGGFTIAYCTPDDDEGVCLEGAINVIEAKLKPGISFSHTTVSDGLGHSASNALMKLDVGWSISMMTGSIEAKIVTPFFTFSYTLLEYEGFKVGEGSLKSWERYFRKELQ
ncbi:MAG: hypothetical protein K1X89_08485 [Myxococcaceae bacterium]|nr:hypothetical protein [Myxococcaceae bacterium]